MNKQETAAYRIKLEESRRFLSGEIAPFPPIAMVAGSGLGGILDKVRVIKKIDFSRIPFFPISSVKGHKGQLAFASWNKQNIIILSGRKHCYEGQPLSQVVLPVRVLGLLGLKILILTNAAGSLNPYIIPGDIMCITDHINLMFRNPLIGFSPEEWGPRFPDMSDPYDKTLREIALEVALERNIPLKQGAYAGLPGPNYETRAEVSFLGTIGADVVGMSTVPENIVANQMGIRVLGLSYISNSHALKPGSITSHEEVIQNAKLVGDKFISLMDGFMERIGDLMMKENV
ncbi:purine-nucleoside phosphorylase [Candidatus Sumerlaeota bacterium]|nr:purine-nucleoside phosphorylase [Candidatus Sumerlaeota bacterium]